MTIIRNSAVCVYCKTEIESKHRHDFQTHTCDVHPEYERRWQGDELVYAEPKVQTYNFAVDGGKSYLRRLGEGFKDTSILTKGDPDSALH